MHHIRKVILSIVTAIVTPLFITLFSQNSPAPKQKEVIEKNVIKKNVIVLESPEIHISVSVETGPEYPVNEDFSVDTRQGISSVIMESALEDVIELEERHPEVLKLVEGMNDGFQDLKVKLLEFDADLKNKH